jgi:hypothetical protein
MEDAAVTELRDWQRNRAMWIRVLEKQTGDGLSAWSRRLRRETFRDVRQLESWLAKRHVTGYARQLLVMECFGYPDFITATGPELIAKQYVARPELRAIYDAVVDAATACGTVAIQARKSYVSLVSPRRTFARVQPTGKAVVLGLRLDGHKPGGRLLPSAIHETMRLQINLASRDEVDADVRSWLDRAYRANA